MVPPLEVAAPTARDLVAAQLRDLDGFPRGRGVQRSDVARAVLLHVRARWSATAGAPLPAALNGRGRHLVEGFLEEVWPLVGVLMDQGSAVSALVVAELGEAHRAPALISERVCAAVWARLRATGRPLADPELREVSGLVSAGLLVHEDKLGRAEFADRYADAYDRAWTAEGAANLAAHPPEGIGLGSDRRPPLVADPHRGAEGGWFAGTDRSVYSRFALHANANAATRGSAGRAGAPATGRWAGRDLGLLEVARACRPYGLWRREHAEILRGLYAGTQSAASGGGALRAARERWRAFTSAAVRGERAMSDLLDASGLARIVAAYSQVWLADRSRGAQVARRYEPLDARWGEVAAGVVRKAWMDLLRHEREQAGPYEIGRLPRLIVVAFDQGVPRALERWDTLPATPPRDEVRINNTLALLTSRPRLRLRIEADFAGDSWHAEYEQAVRERVGAAVEACLSVAELLGLASDLMPTEEDR